MNLQIFKNSEELMNALATCIVKTADEAIASRGRFNFVLSGGSSPRKLYKLLASKEFKKKIDWKNTFFFFGDERFVPENDSKRNSRMAKEVLFNPLKIEKSHIFEVDTTKSPEIAAESYMNTIQDHFRNDVITFDFILLGLGGDAHTASLFPKTTVLKETQATVKSIFVKKVNMNRITMTAPLINQARTIAFLVYGEAKAEAVFRVIEDKTVSSTDFPAKLIAISKKKTKWFMDIPAASKL